MAEVTRRIGLSLGADICWPASYEAILKELDLSLPDGHGNQVKFAVSRVQPQPFDLEAAPPYDLVLDRISHWFMHTREWVKKIIVHDDVYVLNNPWSIQSYEKHTTYTAMQRLRMPVPRTVMLPQKEYKDEGDVLTTVRKYNKLFDLGEIGRDIGYPAFLKPYDGGGWVGVKRVKNEAELRKAYDESSTRVQHLQAAVKDWDLFIRAIGVGPQVNVVKYDPDAPLHARYVVDFNFVSAAEWQRAVKTCRVINAFFGWDFNSCEMLRSNGVLYPIDFANACPDSQVTSLHYHFPWLVKALLRWSVFVSTTKRRPTMTVDWRPYLDRIDPEMNYDEQLEVYDQLARAHFDSERFAEFDAKHLGTLDEVAHHFFGTEQFRGIVREKVTALFPKHEIEEFTDHFFGMVQFWRRTERERMDQKVTL